ncbi:MAG: hypothetical protein LQ347_002329 [Umbilicaria vellea]|nr:MAG: hypothetical protein LQ347_002329 [Umbilicaria vellea]
MPNSAASSAAKFEKRQRFVRFYAVRQLGFWRGQAVETVTVEGIEPPFPTPVRGSRRECRAGWPEARMNKYVNAATDERPGLGAVKGGNEASA